MTERPTLAVGLMSGTSLDGMDAALVRLHGPTHADLIDFVTRPYTDDERGELRRALGRLASVGTAVEVTVPGRRAPKGKGLVGLQNPVFVGGFNG